MLTYFLSASIYLALFYVIYRVVFHPMTFFAWNRALIVAGVAFALLAPILPTDVIWHARPPKEFAVLSFSKVQQILTERATPAAMESPHPWSSLQWITLVYLLGTGLMFLRFCGGLYRIGRLIGKTAGGGIVETKSINASFFGWIFLQSDLEAPSRKTVLLHEQYHARRWHSLDNLCMEGLRIVFWFHPLVYRLHGLLRETHEWETDAYMRRQMDPKVYAHLLLGLNASANPALCHGYNASLLAKRMHVMFQKPTIAMKKVMYLLLIPAMAASVALVSPLAARAQLQSVTITGALPVKGVFWRQAPNEDVLVLALDKIMGPENGVLQEKSFVDFRETGLADIMGSFSRDGWELASIQYVDTVNGSHFNVGFGLTPLSRLKDFGDHFMASATYRVSEVISDQLLIVCRVDKKTGQPRVFSMPRGKAEEVLGLYLPQSF